MEYRFIYSNGIWYAQQFDACRRMTAHAKILNTENIPLWLEEMENLERVQENERSDYYDDTITINNRSVRVYTYSAAYDQYS